MAGSRYIMIGAPVTAARTPDLLARHFADLGIAVRIDVRHVDAVDLDGFIREARADAAVHGLLVTMPHKKTIIPHLQAVSAVAQRVASVNAAKRTKSGGFVGAQFDGAALVNALHAKHIPLARARVLLLGVGGAGLAIAQAIATHGCRHLTIADRDPRVVDAAMKILPGDVVGKAPNAGHGSYDLLINATPMGMAAGDPSPFDAGLVAGASSVADIVADPPRTRLQSLAQETGATFVSGRDMVKGQIALIGDWLLAPDIEQTTGGPAFATNS